MSVTFGFYNSLAGDRKYNTLQISSLFDGLIRDGIFMSIGAAMVVKSVSGMDIQVGIGRAWFNRTWTYNDSLLPLTVEASELVLPRIDAVVVDVDANEEVRANDIKLVKGTPSSTPVAPTMIKTTKHNQYPLCYIYVAPGTTTITQANITNKVGTSDCPFVTGILDTVNIDDLIAQWDADFGFWKMMQQTSFEEWREGQEDDFEGWSDQQRLDFENWFAQLEDILDENVAGNLLVHIDTHINDDAVHHTVITRPFVLAESAWVGEEAPYTQSVIFEEVDDELHPESGPRYSSDLETRLLQREAWNQIGDIESGDGEVIFTCDDEKPEVDIPIQIRIIK